MWLCLRAAGFQSVPLSAVNVRFPNATPVDGQAAIAESSGKIAARLASRRTEMNNQGIEEPDAELKRIVIEEKMLQLATGAASLAADANTAARVGKRGGFAEEEPQEAEAGGSPAPLGDATATDDEDIARLLARFDALAASETSC